ncbi:MAG: hypothetical protein A2786_03880 [Candidatus Chisholmbacteria bacterium RIFCSPHIGHO2_01_FULL_52_32]|uniref:Uncharacterized protein n=1 Tax=Candidatus Chisholmbacteria bacterium RIFCSPHIGHO2_01_FULL_52_32 TaxID=1797591 RepID=A0A1G1VTC6_9BACT|nr:MAG: hypothetical protein A2786_03880 [Candidatus Chisholmbacteria bacterium RIFCSPHIGHO2_01_FULL_52_32]
MPIIPVGLTISFSYVRIPVTPAASAKDPPKRMIQFLTALLLFVFGFNPVTQPPVSPVEILALAEEHLSQIEVPAQVEVPVGDPVSQHAQGPQDSGEANPPAQIFQDSQNDEDPEDPPAPSVSQQGTEPEQPDTTKVTAYNTSSGTVIEQVAAVAVEHAGPLVSCDDPTVSELCEESSVPESDPEPTPTPTPTPPPGDPEPPFPPPPCPPFPHSEGGRALLMPCLLDSDF